MTECPHCHSVKVVLVRARGGYEYLCNLGGPHRFTCSVNKKSRPKLSEADREMSDALGWLGWDTKKVKRLLPHAKGDTFEARFRAALAYADSEDR